MFWDIKIIIGFYYVECYFFLCKLECYLLNDSLIVLMLNFNFIVVDNLWFVWVYVMRYLRYGILLGKFIKFVNYCILFSIFCVLFGIKELLLFVIVGVSVLID